MATIPTALRPRLSRRAAAILLVSALGVPLVAGAGWIAFSSDSTLGAMELSSLRGKVTIVRGSEAISVGDTADLRPGDLIKTGSDASAVFNLAGNRGFEMIGRSSVRVLTTAAIGLESGSVLARAEEPVRAEIGEVTATGPAGSIFRLDRTTTVRAGVYVGSAAVSAPGETDLDISPLFEARIPLAAPDVPSRAAPYFLNEDDAWDAKYMKSVITLDEQLTGLADGLSNLFGDARPSLEYYRKVAGADVGFVKSYRNERPSDLFFGLAVAREVKSRSLQSAFAEAMDLFDRGARWGVTAHIMGVGEGAKGDKLLANVRRFVTNGVGGGAGSAAAQLLEDSGSGSTGPGGSNENSPGGGPIGGNDGNGNNDDPIDKPGDPKPPPDTDPPDDDDPPKPKDPPPECQDDIDCTLQDQGIEPPVENPIDQEVGDKLGVGGGSKKGSGDSIVP